MKHQTPIELAKEHGVHNQNLFGTCDRYVFNDEQLDAYNRALVAPYVEALQKYTEWEKHYGSKLGPAGKALAAHREMFGDVK